MPVGFHDVTTLRLLHSGTRLEQGWNNMVSSFVNKVTLLLNPNDIIQPNQSPLLACLIWNSLPRQVKVQFRYLSSWRCCLSSFFALELRWRFRPNLVPRVSLHELKLRLKIVRHTGIKVGFRPSFDSGHFATRIGPVCLYGLPEEHFILSRILPLYPIHGGRCGQQNLFYTGMVWTLANP